MRAVEPTSGARYPGPERRGFGEPEDIVPGRPPLRRDDPGRMAGRAGRAVPPDEHERPRRLPQQRRPDAIEDDDHRGRVLPRRGDAPDRPRGVADPGDPMRRSGDLGVRPRGIADTGDQMRRSGDLGARPWGVADTGDRPRGIADTGDRPRGFPDQGDRPRGIADTGDQLRRSGDLGVRPWAVGDTGDRPRGLADPGDAMRRSGDLGVRPRGIADTGDRPRGVTDTGDHLRGIADTGDRPRAARAAVPIAGRAVVAEPVRRPTTEPLLRPDVRPEPRPEVRPEPRPGRAVERPSRAARRALAAAEPDFVRRISSPELHDARGYSHATVATGQFVFLAGQLGADPDGRIVEGGLVSQFDRALQNLLTALEAAGGSPEHLASVTVEVTSIDEYKGNSRQIGRVWRTLLGDQMPALSVAEVRRFWDADAQVQITGQAIVP